MIARQIKKISMILISTLLFSCLSNNVYELPEGAESALVSLVSKSNFTAVYVEQCFDIDCTEFKSIGMFGGEKVVNSDYPKKVFIDLEAGKEITLRITTKVTLIKKKDNFIPKKVVTYQEIPTGILVKTRYDYSELADENNCSVSSTFKLIPNEYYKILHFSKRYNNECSMTIEKSNERPIFEKEDQ